MGPEHFLDQNSFTSEPLMHSTHQLPQQHHHNTPPPTVDPSSTTTIKMEDLSLPFPHSTPFPPPSSTSSGPSPSPAPGCSSESKPVKKRKSWGQVLPEPKTSLPPRKRAKTEDEKEQRRIERVKRNRLAAHNSRERKRQEVELLMAEKDKLEAELNATRDAMRRMSAELRAFKERHPNESFASSTTSDEDYDSIMASSTSETICPRNTSFPSPVSMDSMSSPRDDSCQPDSPAYSESGATEFDTTRYPAEILCDLQCQSNPATSRSRSQPPSPFQTTLALVILFQCQLLSMMKSLQTWTRSSTSTRSQLLASTISQTFSPWLTSPTLLSQTLTAFQTSLRVQSLSTCRMTPAQLSLLATSISQRKSSRATCVARPRGFSRQKLGRSGTDANRQVRSHRVRGRNRRRSTGFSSCKVSSASWQQELGKAFGLENLHHELSLNNKGRSRES
ncbi:hypothetical protein BCR34DRAFT_554879 [Clohesyomyces aquaticus]|uniref:BZIP domain-containing protein n=1 Tax=Clohesyomyces aquaticus TaxID=1231657 RepID=A0A1Y2A645_9PLEO|nr:hypothetical protein BCR34DRAFT_554879 [Clohesyomyces aquaticus]